MNRNEAETRYELIDPILREKGYRVPYIKLETPAPVEPIGPKGRRRRGPGKIDYLLCVETPNALKPLPIAILEAKKENEDPLKGMQQGKGYSDCERFDTKYVFSTNGHRFAKYSKFNGEQTGPFPFSDFPDHAKLTACYAKHMGIKVTEPEASMLFMPDSPAYPETRYYQDAAIQAAFEKIIQCEQAHEPARVLLSLATGSGKTIIAANLLWRLHEAEHLPKPALFLCDRNELREQAYTKLKAVFGDNARIVETDFYRARNDAGISLLSKIDALHDQTITTCQLAMEFKKNRQKVITESVSLLKPPEFNLSTPAFLSDAATVKVIKDRIQDVKRRVEKMKGRILSTMENPKTHDRIYQTIQRLFNNTGCLNLSHDTPEYKAVWRKALRRFLEGRPPRKKEDTSAGDAINWEWIVHCIQQTNRDVIIVSRDADYGLTVNGKGYANNWLTDEVKQRVNQQRKLILVDRLSAALKLLDVKVTREEIRSERAIIESTVPRNREVENLIEAAIFGLLNGEEMSSLIAETNTCGWSCDGFSVDHIEFKDGVWTAPVSFSFSGEQEDDKPWHGDTISGRCVVEIDQEKNVTVSDFEADVERGRLRRGRL